MIRSFRSKRLKRLYQRGLSAGVPPNQISRLRRILAALDAAQEPADLDLPGYHLHQLKGERKGLWAVKVNANWRVTFRLESDNAHDVDLVDYH